MTNALAGQVAGVQATSNNGQPGKDAEVRIRGIGSISASNKPLYVVCLLYTSGLMKRLVIICHLVIWMMKVIL